ncbi:hypothetical protein VCHC70A1_1658, partial [Vibrio cholerae HC-70A1]
MFNAG